MSILHGRLFFDFLTIIVINLVLSGDNAVVIALAVKSLPARLRVRALVAGAAAAVLMRVAGTFFAGWLLEVPFLKLIGGITILWIAVTLFRPEDEQTAAGARIPVGFWKAIWFILIADVTMSLDNILAIAEVAKQNLALLIFGLGLSIPLVLFASGLLSVLLDKYPIIVYLGAALLGKIGAEMILTDRLMLQRFTPAPWLLYTIEAAAAIGVVVAGKLLFSRSTRSMEAAVKL